MTGATPQLVRHRLDNGLAVVVERNTSLPLVAVNVRYHVGSKNERPGRTGFAHLFEHMLFQGSQHVGTNDHFAHVQRVGGVANGSTSRDTTTYYETLPAEHLELGLWLESDRMGFLLPALTAEKLENQRQVVMNERRQRVDNQPYGRASERLFELLYPPPHPYSWPVIGTMEDIAAARLEEIAEFFQIYYRPSNAVLALVGDVDPDAALRAAERWFGSIPNGAPPPPMTAPPPVFAGPLRDEGREPVQLARVYRAYPLPPFGRRAWYAADLAAYVLADGKSSPLHHDLVYRRQLATSVGAYVYGTELDAAFLLVATARPGVAVAEVEEALDAHVCRLAEALPAAPDLERARNRIVHQLFDGLQRVDRRAELYTELTLLFDEPERLASEADRYLELPAAAVTEVAASCLRPERSVTVVVHPGGGAA